MKALVSIIIKSNDKTCAYRFNEMWPVDDSTLRQLIKKSEDDFSAQFNTMTVEITLYVEN